MSLTVSLAIKKNRLLIRLKGELDQSNVEGLRNRINEVTKKYQIKYLVFNLENLQFMDSSGIGFIIGRYGEIRRIGGKVAICAMNETIYKIFKLSGLSRICLIAKNEDYADQLLGVAI